MKRMSAQGPFDVAIAPLWFWGQCSLPEMYFPLLESVSPGTLRVVVTDDVHAARSRALEVARAALERGEDAAPRCMMSCIIIYGDVSVMSSNIIIVCDDPNHAK